MVSQKVKFAGLVLANQLLFLIIFGWKGGYGPTALPNLAGTGGGPPGGPPGAAAGRRGPAMKGLAADNTSDSQSGPDLQKGPAYDKTGDGDVQSDQPSASLADGNANAVKDANATSGQGRGAGRGGAGKGAGPGGEAARAAMKKKMMAAMLPPGGYLPLFHESFKDTHLMTVIGFGLLATFLGRYGHSSLAVSLLTIAFVVQDYIMISSMLATMGTAIRINIISLLTADYAAVAVLISLGAVMGKLSPSQTLIMASNEVVFFAVNQFLGMGLFKVSDVGNSMFVHVFGAYFGLAVSRVMYNPSIRETNKEAPSNPSNIFSILGTLFLWTFWPSFNSAFAMGDAKHRAVINTYIALAASCMVTFAVSGLVSSNGKLSMRHIQRATLAGGVAVGTCANMLIHPGGAILIGMLAGAISTLSLAYVEPFLNYKFKIHDTCGVHSLHGIPGILAGVAGATAAAFASLETYGFSLYHIFGARAPAADSPVYMKLKTVMPMLKPGSDRTAFAQMGFQMIALLVTILLALLGGAITGFFLRLPFMNDAIDKPVFDDAAWWQSTDPKDEESAPEKKTKLLNEKDDEESKI